MAQAHEQQKRRQVSWLQQMKMNQNYVRLESSGVGQSQTSKTIRVQVCDLIGLQAVSDLKNVNLNEQDKQKLARPPDDIQKHLQCFYSLYHKKHGFYGRSLTGQPALLKNAKITDIDWCLWHTDLDQAELKESFIVVEYVIRVKSTLKNVKADQKAKDKVWEEIASFGLGFSLVACSSVGKLQSIEVYEGSPRQLLSKQMTALIKSSQLKADLTFEEMTQFDQGLKRLLPVNFLIGPQCVIPGLSQSRLPVDLKQQPKVSSQISIYCHNLKLLEFKRIDSEFNQYLQQLVKQKEKPAQNQPVKFEIKDRKLVASQHNSLHDFAHQSISITQDAKGEWEPSGTLKIPGYLCHPQVALCFSLVYSVQLTLQQKQTIHRDFLIGYCVYMPILSKNQSDIVDTQVDQLLQMGPGRALTGEMLWDQTQTQRSKGLAPIQAILSIYMSSSDTAVKSNQPVGDEAAQARQKELEMQQQEEKRKRVEAERAAAEAERKRQEIEAENVRLQEEARKAKEAAEKKAEEKKEEKKEEPKPAAIEEPPKVLEEPQPKVIEEPAPKKFEFDKSTLDEEMRKLYIKENVEIEQLIKQVMQGQDPNQKLNKDSTESLLKFLISVIMSKETLPTGLQNSTDQRKQSLLTLLKTDPKMREELFGHLHAKSKEVGEIANVNPDQQRGFGYVPPHSGVINMDLEYNDTLKECNFQLKFQSLKAPVLPEGKSMPKSVKFVFSFFQFRAEETDNVDLELLSQAMKTGEKSTLQGAQYWLTHAATKAKLQPGLKEIEKAMSAAFVRSYQVSAHQNKQFVNYLKEQILEVAVYDAESNFLYGSGNIQLSRSLRQGQKTRIFNAEVDLLDQDDRYVGTLLVVVTNEGLESTFKQADRNMETMKEEHQLSTMPLRSKKVYSKPMQPIECDQLIRETAMQYLPNCSDITEEARKKLRMNQYRQQTTTVDTNSRILCDPRAGEWAKHQALKQIQMARELKKRQILFSQ